MPPRAVLILAAILLALGACGRRGPLEAPGAAAAPARGAARVAAGPAAAGSPAIEGQSNAPGQAQVDDSDAEREALLGAPIATPPRGTAPRRGFTVPQTPFVLDPLL